MCDEQYFKDFYRILGVEGVLLDSFIMWWGKVTVEAWKREVGWPTHWICGPGGCLSVIGACYPHEDYTELGPMRLSWSMQWKASLGRAGREGRKAKLERAMREIKGQLLCLGKLKERWRMKIIRFSVVLSMFPSNKDLNCFNCFSVLRHILIWKTLHAAACF